MNINFRIRSLVTLVFTSGALFAQNPKQQIGDLALDPTVRAGKLPNGFTYYIRHNTEPKNRVIFYLANKVGSILENEDQRGLAHFMEHMSFNGTKHFPKNELIDYLQKSGVRFGADLNAYTSFDETVYQLPLPSDNPELLQGGIQIMRDWAQDAILDPGEINKERGVVLEEKRLGKGASERMRQLYFPVILNHSRYADRLPIGVDTVLNNFTPANLKSFYQDWYRPDLQALIVVGDVNVDEIEKSIKIKFSDLKNPGKQKPRTVYSVSLTGKNQFISVTDKENRATSAEILIKHPELEIKTAADHRIFIIRTLFNTMLGARYAELIKQADPPYISGGAAISNFLSGLDAYSARMTARPGALEKGVKALWRETVRARRFGFTEPELKRAKKNYMDLIEYNFKEKDKTTSTSYVNEYLQYFLKGTAAPGIAEEYRLAKIDLPAIGIKDINAFCKGYIRSTDRDILIMAPETEKIGLPVQSTVEGWLSQVEAEILKPYKDEMSKLPLLSHEPIAGKTVKQESEAILHTTTLTLSNGIKVLLKPTDFKNDQVLFNAFAPGGTSLYSDADYQSANYAATVAGVSGLGNYNASDFSKYLNGKQVGASVGIDELYQLATGGSTKNELETMLRLTYARFTEPRLDKGAFESFINRIKASLSNRANDPNTVFADTVNAVLYHGNIRRSSPSASSLEQINPDRAFEIYKERFADASNFTFVFVGSFTVNELKPLLEKYLGSLPSSHKSENYMDLGIRLPAGKIEKTVYKGTEPKATVDLIFSGTFTYTTVEKAQLDALKEVLQIRLNERLREEESSVYSPGVSENVNKSPNPRYSFTISFGCSPNNVEKLIASVLDEINKLRVLGPAQVNVDKYKAEDQRGRETDLKSNVWWMGYLVDNLQNRENLYEVNDYQTNLSKISPASLKSMADKYLNGDNLIRLVLMPEKASDVK
jgi:zinc protease